MAIIGDEAMTSPISSMFSVYVKLSASADAASESGPSLLISNIGGDWIACCVTLARISGQASARVARSSIRHAFPALLVRDAHRLIHFNLGP